MAGAAVLGRLTWRVGRVVALRDETSTARSVVLDVPGWPGHLAGQHLDVRLTAPDGYSAVRSYSMATEADGDLVEVTVDRVPDGEVSPYLTQVLAVGDALEVRGPIGGWFVWRPGQDGPVQLLAGGSGMVPLRAMLRARDRAAEPRRPPMRLLYSVREPEAALYRAELDALAAAADGVRVDYAFTRRTPQGWSRPPGRLDAALLTEAAFGPEQRPTCYVCGPTGFVEAVADLLGAAGHDAARIRTERFGPTGGSTSGGAR
jgi:ferredoxin-NADP reductase